MEKKVCPCCHREFPRNEFSGAYCKECRRKKQREYVERKRMMRKVGNPKLAEFTPRELIEELSFRGYRGELIFEQKVKI